MFNLKATKPTQLEYSGEAPVSLYTPKPPHTTSRHQQPELAKQQDLVPMALGSFPHQMHSSPSQSSTKLPSVLCTLDNIRWSGYLIEI